MKLISAIILSAIIIASCNSSGKKDDVANSNADTSSHISSKSAVDYFILANDSAEIPSFEIYVELSKKAEKKLKKLKESIVVAAYFSGIPKDSSLYMEDGEYAVGANQVELTDSRVALFKGIKIPKKIYQSLADKNIQVLINIFSGRHAAESNLLDCDILQKPISEMRNGKFRVKGKLIGE